MPDLPITRRSMALIGLSIGTFLGVVWGNILFAPSCFYPDDDIPCTLWGWAFSIGLTGVAGFTIAGLPLAMLAGTIGTELWIIIQRQDPVLRTIGWWIAGVAWTAANAILLAMLISFALGVLPVRAATLTLVLLGTTSMVLWFSPRRLPARAFASGVLVTGFVLARLAGLL